MTHKEAVTTSDDWQELLRPRQCPTSLMELRTEVAQFESLALSKKRVSVTLKIVDHRQIVTLTVSLMFLLEQLFWMKQVSYGES